MKNKIGLAQELRDSIDMYQRDMDISKFFDALLPCFINVLQSGKPSFVSNSADHVSSCHHLQLYNIAAMDHLCRKFEQSNPVLT
jgi:hypothetical protein